MTEPAIPPEFDELLQHRGWVRRLCRHLVANEAEADEVEQDTWRRAIEAPPRHAGNLRSWLSSVVRSSAAQRRRGESRRHRAHERLEDQQLGAPSSESMPSGQPSGPDALAERRETFEVLNRLLAGLEEPYGRVVYLRFVDGLPPRSIAKQLDIPVATVKTRLHRGLALLRGRLHLEYGDTWRNRCLVFTPSFGSLAAKKLSTTLSSLQTTQGVFIAALLLLVSVTLVLADLSSQPDPSKSVLPELAHKEAGTDSSSVGSNPTASLNSSEFAQRTPIGLGEGAGATIRVRVIDSQTRAPVEHAEVLVVDEAMLGIRYAAYVDMVNWTWPKPREEQIAEVFGRRYRTDENGEVEFDDYRSASLFMVTRTESQLGVHRRATVLFGSAVNEVESQLWPREQLPVRVTGSDELPVANMIVHFGTQSPRSPRWMSRASARTNARGEALIQGIGQAARGYQDGTRFAVWLELSGAGQHLVEVDPRAFPTDAIELRAPKTVPLTVHLPKRKHLPLARYAAIRLMSNDSGMNAPIVQARASREETIARGVFREGSVHFEHVAPGFFGALQVRLGTSVREHYIQPFSIPQDVIGPQSITLDVPEPGNRILIKMQNPAGEALMTETWIAQVIEAAELHESLDHLDVLAAQPHTVVLEERPSFVRENPDTRKYTISAYGRSASGRYSLAVSEFDAAELAKKGGEFPFLVSDDLILSGVIVNQDGEPIPFAPISISDGKRHLENVRPSGSIYELVADEQGRFELRGEVPGLTVLDIAIIDAGVARHNFVTGEKDREFEVVLSPRLQGRVIVADSLDVSKLRLKLTHLDDPDALSAVWIDANTHEFRFSGLSAGRVQLEIADSIGDVVYRSPEFQLLPGKTAQPDFLNPLQLDAEFHEHRLSVLDSSGQPLVGFTVHVIGEERVQRGSNPLGIFTTESQIEVVVDAEGYAASKLTPLKGKAEVRLAPALALQLVLPEDVDLSHEHVHFVAHLELDGLGKRPPLDRLIVLRGTETTIELPSPGNWRLSLLAQPRAWRESGFVVGFGPTGPKVELPSGSELSFEVLANGEPTVLNLNLTQAALAAAADQVE